MDVVVFTGTLTKWTRKEASSLAAAKGYKVGASLTAATTILVYGDNAGKKLEDAKKKGVQLYSEDEWQAKIGGGDAGEDDVAENDDEDEKMEEIAKPNPPKKKPTATKAAAAAVSHGSESTDVVVFTGTLVKYSRKEAKGYRVDARVTKATTILVCGERAGERAGQKRDEAEKMGIQIFTEGEWNDKLDAMASTADAEEDQKESDEPTTTKRSRGKAAEQATKAAPKRKAAASTSDGCSSEVVVFTGTLTKWTRKEASSLAEAKGYKVGSSLTAATTILVYGDNAGKKLEDAKKKGVQLYSEDEWEEKMGEEGGADDDAQDEDEEMEGVEESESERSPTKRGQVKATKPVPKRKAAEAAGDASGSTDVVVFTGTLVKYSRKEATASAEAKGFRVDPRVTKATTILVCGERAGQKRDEAENLGIQIFTEDEWNDKLDAMDDSSASPPAAKKTKQEPQTEAAAADDDELEYDAATGAINGVAPKTLIVDGTFFEAKSSSSNSTYLVKRLGSTYSCNCPAWRNQRHAPTARTCKHLKEILGDAFEAVRAKGSATQPQAATSKTGSSKTVTKASARNVLLAKKWEREKNNPVDWWISEKLDGVRAYWDARKGVFLSRLGNVYPAPEWFTTGFPKDIDLDGELFGGRGRFQFTVGIAKTDGSKHWDQLVYKVFDVPSLTQKPFEDRMTKAQELITSMASKYVEWVEHTQCKSMAHLDEVFDQIEKLGGEGLMIREPASKYSGGRSSSLLKIKSFHDGEAQVIAHEDGKGKYTGMCGALRCKMASGKMFKVASGLSDEQRENPPAIGAIVVYKCQELTNDGIPRFPVFVGIAADKDGPNDPIIANAIGREE